MKYLLIVLMLCSSVLAQPPDHARKPDKPGIPDHALEKIPEHKREAVESVINLRGRPEEQKIVAYYNRITVRDMNPVWAREEVVEEDELLVIIGASVDRTMEEITPKPLILTEIDIAVLELIDIHTISLMLADLDVYSLETISLEMLEVMIHKLTLASIETIPVEVIQLMLAELGISDLQLVEPRVFEIMLAQLQTHEIRDIFVAKFDEMSASEELFWMLSSKRISVSLTPEFASMEVKPQARLTEFIAVDYDKAVQRGSQVAVLDGAEMDLLAFQRQVTDDTKLIVLNHVDGRMTNYFYKELTHDDYVRIADRIRSRRNLMNKLYPDIPTAPMVVVGRGNSDLLLLDLLGFEPDYLLLHGLSNPYAQWDAVARRYEKYGVKIIAGSVNEIRGLPTGGEAWQYVYNYMKQDDRYAGFLWRNPETPGGAKRVETRKP